MACLKTAQKGCFIFKSTELALWKNGAHKKISQGFVNDLSHTSRAKKKVAKTKVTEIALAACSTQWNIHTTKTLTINCVTCLW